MKVQLVIFLAMAVAAESAANHSLVPNPNCKRHCGKVEIPYPFGMSSDCYLHDSLLIDCNHTELKPYIGNIEVQRIDTKKSVVYVLMSTARICYNNTRSTQRVEISLKGSSYTISDMNRFTAIGCNIMAKLHGSLNGQDYMFGCLSYCSSPTLVQDHFCSGIGCCQTHIPKGLTVTKFTVTNISDSPQVSNFNPCGYAFLVDREKFNFSKTYLSEFNRHEVPLKMDWSVGNKTCEIARKEPNFACKAHSECHNSIDGSGYVCKCSEGYQGNPYEEHGCEDIDECSHPSLNNCTQNCINTGGGYNCSCYDDYSGDGRKDGTGCQHLPLIVRDKLTAIKIIVAVGVSFIATVVVASWMFLMMKRRRLDKLKEEFFKKNGGFILQQQLSSQGSTASFKIFSDTELKNATNNYHESTILGKGGFGTVYKGVLEDGRVIAIKKSNTIDQIEIEQFINEVIVLSQINHKNVIKLLGCCLETKVPLLVYEFASKGTLFSYIHGNNSSLISWEIRLRIASETAEAFSYLHFATSTPIIHRDIKTTNILLDENYSAKICDFGASKFIPVDQIQLATVVQGTLGYLDPEYLQTSQLTEKSDVYSFGVVLVELLTGLTPLSYNRSQEERCLAMMFLYYHKEGKLFQIVESHIAKEENIQEIREVAELAKRCLNVKGDERPTMKQVATELEEILMKSNKRKGQVTDINSETKEVLVAETSKTCPYVDDAIPNVEYDSMKNHAASHIEDGR